MEENNLEQGEEVQDSGQKESTKRVQTQLITLLLVLGGIVLIIISVFLIFMPTQTENEQLQLTVQQKEQEYQQTLAIAQKQAEYEQEIEVAKANIENILASYPSDVKYEDEIYYVHDVLETNYASADFNSLSFSPQLMLISSDQAVAAQNAAAQAPADGTTDAAAATDANAAAAAGGISGYQLYSTPLALSGTINYDDFKQLIDFVNNDTLKKNYDTINLTFDQTTGNLSVSMNLNFLTIAGTDKEYEPSVIPDLTGVGKENIFGSLSGGGTATDATVTEGEGTTENADAGSAEKTDAEKTDADTKKSSN